MRTGTVNLPLHGGKCPTWLFNRMKELGSAIIQVIVEEFGSREVLYRLSDPVWFQALGCVLGFDWHSSGITTTVCSALKEGLKHCQGDMGLFFAGGKGAAARKTPLEIIQAGDNYGLSNNLTGLQEVSRLTAKIDNAALQDGYQLYHHFFIFTAKGDWAVVQQGMNTDSRYVRRYHWISEHEKNYLSDPHSAICCDNTGPVLNMAASKSEKARSVSLYLAREAPGEVNRILNGILEKKREPEQLTLFRRPHESREFSFTLPRYHPVPKANKINKILQLLYEKQPEDYLTLLSQPGVGPATIRALAMVSEIAYGTPASFKDPVRFSFAHGGKDGYPYPVNCQNYDTSINVLRTCLENARIGNKEKIKALKRLAILKDRSRGQSFQRRN